LEAIKKDRHYEVRLKDAHDTLQNLGRLETVIDRFFDTGKVVIDQQKRKAFF
jgi:glycyl-tRNA synthetase beta subunit